LRTRAVESAMGRRLDPLRVRANVYIDGPPAWAEFDRMNTAVTFGGVPCQGVRRTRRRLATNVDPVTTNRDTDVPRAMRDKFGYADRGVYLQMAGSGSAMSGDGIGVPVEY
jgi:uncharacterized protein